MPKNPPQIGFSATNTSCYSTGNSKYSTGNTGSSDEWGAAIKLPK